MIDSENETRIYKLGEKEKERERKFYLRYSICIYVRFCEYIFFKISHPKLKKPRLSSAALYEVYTPGNRYP